MLAVLWGAEYFRNYILRRKFLVVTDQKALVSPLNGNNKKNKTRFSRLTRWLDRLIPFDFQVEHEPGKKSGWRIICHDIQVMKQHQLVPMTTFFCSKD